VHSVTEYQVSTQRDSAGLEKQAKTTRNWPQI